jgi:hypothetical protein
MPCLEINLKDDITKAERTIDRIRPAHIDLYFGQQLLGSIRQQYGFEPLRGAHLRAVLAKEFNWDLLKAIAFDKAREEKQVS